MTRSGSFVWYELMTPDPAAAVAFYGEAIGWTSRPAGPPGMNYTVMQVGERGVAGVTTLAEGAPGPRWTGTIGVADVDATADAFRHAGGEIRRAPADMPGIGRFAVVTDPQGATVSLFRPGDGSDAPPPAGPETPGHVGWHELLTTDNAAAFAFYAGLFGWTPDQAMDMGAMGTYRTFRIGETWAGGMMDKPAQIPGPPFWLYYFYTESIAAGQARVETAGGRTIMGPHEVPGGFWIVQCLDPQGAAFALVSGAA